MGGHRLKSHSFKLAPVVATLIAAATAPTIARADGPITLWYQRGGNPEQQRILQKDLVEPFKRAQMATRKSAWLYFPARARTSS
jgi:hypothetical protein